MRGDVLRQLRKERGLQAAWVAKRAGYAQPHYSKIEEKDSIRVDEFVRIMKAMDLKPGDFLENSIGEIRPMLPIVEELRRFSPRAYERVREVLRSLALLLEENIIEIGLRDAGHAAMAKQIYNSAPASASDEPSINVTMGPIEERDRGTAPRQPADSTGDGREAAARKHGAASKKAKAR